MSRREKILVIASVAAFIWGMVMVAGQLGQDRGAGSTPVKDVSAFVAAVGTTVNEDPSKGLDAMVLSRARGPWGDNPFYEAGPVNYDPGEDLHYQGYVRSGSRVIALINNREYRLGETMEGRDIKVRAITADRVVLVDQSGRKRILPLEGDL